MATPKAIASASSSPVAAGAFTDELNQPLTVAAINGYLMIKMAVQDFSVATLTGGGQVMATESIKINLDANGIPVAGQSMFASDQFSSPVNPPFNVFVYNGSSREVGVIKNAVISGSAPIDLTALISTAVGASFPSPAPTSTPVTYSATPAFIVPSGLQSSVLFTITLTGNVTSSTLTNAAPGQLITFIITQDAIGSRTFAWPPNVRQAESVSIAAASINVQSFIFNGTNAYPIGPMTVN